MMYCSKILQRNYITSVSLVLKAKYSRRSAKNTNSYKLIKSDESLRDLDNTEFGVNPNWELLAPRGFRFYMPGSVGPGWLDATTTAQVESRSPFVCSDDELSAEFAVEEISERFRRSSHERMQPTLRCLAQECPTLLRKGLLELFPGCVEVASPQLTIVTVSQKLNSRSHRWSKEVETEKLAKFFVLAASDICTQLKMVGYWADFINPFSGQPYLNPLKNNTLYKTDQRFRCLGFKIEQKNHCKIISVDNDPREFVGSLYTTAPSSTEFLKEIMSGLNDH
ncbi:methylmalonic aciduria and homocystinuria type D homolog, mitochondrial-like [Venturia canescens]|uniref:methylmalonic aciduria and homocystinuria type D homolog, mitochondrial-like n=1 Tax=Venturia canescens TaxID=32260 RepID=UPI001C9C8FE8|nr:methylmalonic aciduria and homocystinuria type D homolog, mitochondrial-like [Venturia canescens]